MINLILLIVFLALDTLTVRWRRSPSEGLVSVLFSVPVIVFLARGVNWNGDVPFFVWWLLAAWSAVLIGIQTSRLGNRAPARASMSQS